jgi:hypothetical protein
MTARHQGAPTRPTTHRIDSGGVVGSTGHFAEKRTEEITDAHLTRRGTLATLRFF